MKKANIAGLGMTKFGELWEYDLRKLAFDAGIEAIKESGLELKEIDALYIGNMNASALAGQEHLGALIAGELNLTCPAFNFEAACASGSIAFHNAFLSILSGKYNNILVIGVEKMTDVGISESSKALTGASDEEWEAYYGVTFPSLYAMMAREHMRRYGTTKEDLALVSVKNHFNASFNPLAHFPKEISLQTALDSPDVASPLNLFDCSPVSDGATAVLLSSKVRKYNVDILASEASTGSLALHDRKDICSIDSAVNASKKAYKSANIKPADIDISEVHDCFTIAELIAYEDLGFVEKGKGKNFVREGLNTRDGKLPVNTSGGLKACGHPVGATGIKQIYEIVKQLSSKADIRQIQKDLKYGLTHNVGGSGATCVINIFKRNI